MRNAECGMRNEKERLMQLLDAEFMWSEKDCEAVADYLITSGLGFVDDVRMECGRLIASNAIIINDLHEEIKHLGKENELLWQKQSPMLMDGDKCPVCGRMQFIPASGYCKRCGQALKFDGAYSPTVSEADSSLPSMTPQEVGPADDIRPYGLDGGIIQRNGFSREVVEGALPGDDIEMLTNLNDRS